MNWIKDIISPETRSWEEFCAKSFGAQRECAPSLYRQLHLQSRSPYGE